MEMSPPYSGWLRHPSVEATELRQQKGREPESFPVRGYDSPDLRSKDVLVRIRRLETEIAVEFDRGKADRMKPGHK